MNEEEKKAIESFKDDLNRCKNKLILCRQGLLDLKTILNLIEKMKNCINILDDELKERDKTINEKEIIIEKLQKENEEYKKAIDVVNKEKADWIRAYQEEKDKQFDKIKEILKNGEYRIIFEGDAEFPDEATIITAQKYLKLEKVQKLQQENERLRKQSKIMCDEYCPQMQKIKAKIEELDIAILECEYSDDDSEEYKKEVEKDKLELLKQKRVLQELLEGRK